MPVRFGGRPLVSPRRVRGLLILAWVPSPDPPTVLSATREWAGGLHARRCRARSARTRAWAGFVQVEVTPSRRLPLSVSLVELAGSATGANTLQLVVLSAFIRAAAQGLPLQWRVQILWANLRLPLRHASRVAFARCPRPSATAV